MKKIVSIIALVAWLYTAVVYTSGCAQISAPTGGPTDSIPPKLVRAVPDLYSTGFSGNRITLTFNENIDIQDLQNNLLISPAQKTTATITYNRKSLSIRLKDSLQPNTTYSIDFGNAIKDVHEGNILKNFTYVFSTGGAIDSLTLSGKVTLAETGKADSSIMVFLYHNINDSAVQKTKADYMARVDGNGQFTFRYLPVRNFRLFALKDGDGSKTYNAKTELFAFYDTVVNPATSSNAIQLFAFAEQKPDNNKPISVLKPATEKKLKYIAGTAGQIQDLLQPLELSFNNPLQLFDTAKTLLTDSNFKPVSLYYNKIDQARKTVTVHTNWIPGTAYNYIIQKEAMQDSAGNYLGRTDTLRFNTKNTSDYGTVTLRFANLDLSLNPVIQFSDGESVKYSFPVIASEWTSKLFPPGEFALSILFDKNKNGKWDPGNYAAGTQPEKVSNLNLKLAVKANWDNERDIRL